MKKIFSIVALSLMIASCALSPMHHPSYISGGPLTQRLQDYGLKQGDEVLIRIFKASRGGFAITRGILSC